MVGGGGGVSGFPAVVPASWDTPTPKKTEFIEAIQGIMSFQKSVLLWIERLYLNHKVLIYIKSPLIGIGTPPTPLPHASVSSPRAKGWRAHSPAGEGLGESQFRRLEKSLALCLLCDLNPTVSLIHREKNLPKIFNLSSKFFHESLKNSSLRGGGEGGGQRQSVVKLPGSYVQVTVRTTHISEFASMCYFFFADQDHPSLLSFTGWSGETIYTMHQVYSLYSVQR
jgi:hypothetical protein